MTVQGFAGFAGFVPEIEVTRGKHRLRVLRVFTRLSRIRARAHDVPS